MSRVEEYCSTLAGLEEWDEYLKSECGLPGPRGNLELARAAASLGEIARFRRYVEADAIAAPENTPDAYLVFVGVWGLGWQIAHGGLASVDEVRAFASDSRWRIREAAAIALQTIGDANIALFRSTALAWSRGNRLEQRAAVAGVAEPRLLTDSASAAFALDVLDDVTRSLADARDARSPDSRILRQALGYAWSVVVAAAPAAGKPRFEALMQSAEPDVQWIVKENLAKKRLERMDPEWVGLCRRRVA